MNKRKIFLTTIAIIGYVSLILELTVVDGGFLLATVGVCFSLVGTIGMCICSEKFRNWFFFALDGPCFWS